MADQYYDDVEIRQIDSGKIKRIGGKSKKIKMEAGFMWAVPALAQMFAPAISKIFTGGACDCKEIEKELLGSGLFTDLASKFFKKIVTSPIAQSVGRNLLQTGTKVLADVAVRKGNELIDETAKKYSGGKKSKLDKLVKGSTSGKRERRNAVVKKIMKEKKISLPEASAYVKKQGIPY